MKKCLFIFLIYCVSLTITSCGDEKEEYSATGTTNNTTTDNTTTDNTTTTTDTTAPTISSMSPTDNQSGGSISGNISVTFSETMNPTAVTTNTSDYSCSGTLQVSSDSFSTCVKMSSSPSVSNSYKTFTVSPYGNLSFSTTHKIRVKTGVKDTSGNALGSQYETSSGFTSGGLFVVVGESGNILTSPGGTTWTKRTSGSPKDLMGVAYGNNIFVVTGNSGVMIT